MKNKALLILALIISVTVKAQSVDEIVAHHIEAMGGAKKLAALNSVIMQGSIEVSPGMKAPFTMKMKDQKKVRFELEIQGMKMITACDGETGWKIVPFAGKTDPERMSAEEIKDSKEQADVTGDLFNYKEKGSTVELVDKEDMEGTEVFKLKVTKKSGDVSYLFLDASSYIMLKQTNVIKMADKEVRTTTMMSNFQDVDGYKFPFTIEVRGGDGEEQGQSMTIEKVLVNPVIADSEYAMPDMKPAAPPVQEPVVK